MAGIGRNRLSGEMKPSITLIDGDVLLEWTTERWRFGISIDEEATMTTVFVMSTKHLTDPYESYDEERTIHAIFSTAELAQKFIDIRVEKERQKVDEKRRKKNRWDDLAEWESAEIDKFVIDAEAEASA